MAVFEAKTVTVRALDPDRSIAQYIQDSWESDRGFPGGAVHAITQTSDGYLWIAADRGLVQFDGLAFRVVQPPGVTSRQDSSVHGLIPDRNGGLWAALRNAMLRFYRNGAFEALPPQLGTLLPAVIAIAPANEGAILLSTVGAGVMVYRPGAIETVVPQRDLSNAVVIAMAQTRDGDYWLGTRDSGLLRVHGGRLTSMTDDLPDQKINSLLATENALWIGTANGVTRWDGARVDDAALSPALRQVEAMAMLQDRDANLWIGTASGRLLRVTDNGSTVSGDIDGRRQGPINALFEDREGNLWIGTNGGVGRLRDGIFTSYSPGEGLPTGGGGPVYVDRSTTWVGPTDGGLNWVRGTRVGSVSVDGLDRDVVYSISGASTDLWVGRQRGGLTNLRIDGTGPVSARTFTTADGLAQNVVYAVHRARDGSVWAGTLSGGISQLANGTFRTFTTADGLASNTITAILESRSGAIWLATPNGVSAQSAAGWKRYSATDGLPANEVNALFEDSTGTIWVGTAAGLAIIDDGKVLPALRSPPQLNVSILGMTEDAGGGLWMATAESILRVDRQKLADGSLGDTDVRRYDVADGLLGIEGVKRHRSLVTDDLGRVWVSTSRGLSMTNPARSLRPAAADIVHIESVSADGSNIEFGRTVTVPPGHQRIGITYAGLTMTRPERVQFRYRLDPFDRDWNDAGSTRLAAYTNLRPGDYTFRVVASSTGGTWNGPEAVLPVRIQSALWETIWFRTAAALLIAGVGLVAYRLRLRRVSTQLSLRFQERLDERTRIAQELHDTLLQGLFGASMQLHVTTQSLPEDSTTRSALTRVLAILARVTDEGRNAVTGLRSSRPESQDLAEAFREIQGEFEASSSVRYRVTVEGRPRPLAPVSHSEVYRIGREAVGNAFRHSGATEIDVVLEYSTAGLRLRVHDNGRGVEPHVLRFGVEGHWGLHGMRERSRRVGGRLKTWSRLGVGTVVELTAPARTVFQKRTVADDTTGTSAP